MSYFYSYCHVYAHDYVSIILMIVMSYTYWHFFGRVRNDMYNGTHNFPYIFTFCDSEDYLKDMVMTGLASVLAMAKRRPKDYRHRVDAATRCYGVQFHFSPVHAHIFQQSFDLVTYLRLMNSGQTRVSTDRDHLVFLALLDTAVTGRKAGNQIFT